MDADENVATPSGKSVWGSHVLAAASFSSRSAEKAGPSGGKTSLEMSGKLSLNRCSSFSARKSIKKRKRPSQSAFFDTLSQDGMDKPSSSTPSSQIKRVVSDPLARFDPEISMDGQEKEDDQVETSATSFHGVFNPSCLDSDGGDAMDSSLFTISKAKKKPQIGESLSFISGEKSKVRKQVDQGWLDRCNEGLKSPTKVERRPFNEGDSQRLSPPVEDRALKNKDENEQVKGTQETPLKTPTKEEESSDENDFLTTTPEAKRQRVTRVSNSSPGIKVRKSLTAKSEEPPSTDSYAFGFDQAEEGDVGIVARKFKTKEEKLLSRVGKDNFKRINLKKKGHVAFRKTMTGGRYRRMEFKRKQLAKEGKEAKGIICYNCKQEGHWARDCVGNSGDSLMKVDEDAAEDDGDFLSLEEAAALGLGCKTDNSERVHVYADIVDNDEAMLLEACEKWDPSEEINQEREKKVEPFFNPEQSEQECDKALHECLTRFGFDSFRPGQKEAMTKVLQGKSTLVLQATGSGKSLIYQMPAYLYGQRSQCITLVISPLLSLMEDQIVGLPRGIRGACLHSGLTNVQKEKVAEEVKSGRLHFLLVSPESLSGAGLFATLMKDLPPIAFVCIDEAHCVSQWSHNFRPAYLRLCKVIREKLGVSTILGLTATAPEKTVADIASSLAVNLDENVIRGALMPRNLKLSISKDQDRDRALIALLKGSRFSTCDSIIVYCTRRDDCIRLANLIRTYLQDDEFSRVKNRKGKRRTSLVAEPYHAGLTPSRRRTIQKQFMTGQLRIVVATVAFGMGIDKSDIRAVIHYNLPKTFESYIQEIGRAGRDGEAAHCHLFLDSNGEDLQELKRHIYTNSISEQTIRKFLDIVFNTEEDEAVTEAAKASEYKEVAASLDKTVESLDLPEENIATMLCYLENDRRKWVKVLNHAYANCKILCYGNSTKPLKDAARKCPPLAAAIAIARKTSDSNILLSGGKFEFPVVSVASRLGWDSGIVKRELKNLQWTVVNGKYCRSPITVEFSDLAFRFEALRRVTSEEKDELKSFLHQRCLNREKHELFGLQRIFRAFNAVAHSSHEECSEVADEKLSEKLRGMIVEYFSETNSASGEITVKRLTADETSTVRCDVKQFVLTHTDHKWHGRAVARIFHGIPSPNFPAIQWGKVRRFWRAHLDKDFNQVCSIAQKTILEMKTGKKSI